jgi:predicted nucleic acid binding AN1-type Zn finger protein
MKCFVCKKKVVIVVTCKCDKHLCLKHRMPEDHTCIEPVLFKIETIIKDKVIKI